MKMRNLIFALGAFGLLLSGCSGSSSGGVGSSTSGLYKGTISYTGFNTCLGTPPGRGDVQILISSDGDLEFFPIGLAIGGVNDAAVNFSNAVNGSKISGSLISTKPVAGYKFRIDGRINDGGATISGTGYVEGNYEGCYEKFEGAFAATRVG